MPSAPESTQSEAAAGGNYLRYNTAGAEMTWRERKRTRRLETTALIQCWANSHQLAVIKGSALYAATIFTQTHVRGPEWALTLFGPPAGCGGD